MMLVIKAQEILFSTIDNIHLTSINAKVQVVLDRPITLGFSVNNDVDETFPIKLCSKQYYCRRYGVKL